MKNKVFKIIGIIVTIPYTILVFFNLKSFIFDNFYDISIMKFEFIVWLLVTILLFVPYVLFYLYKKKGKSKFLICEVILEIIFLAVAVILYINAKNSINHEPWIIISEKAYKNN